MSARDLAAFFTANPRVVRVRLAQVRGSCPREEGASMLVAQAASHGTIGGGQLEFRAIAAAREMLADGVLRREMALPLGPEIGQCCGGHVHLLLERLSGPARHAEIAEARAHEAAQPALYILGAGHLGRALAGLSAQMPVHTVLVDPRAGELAQAPAGVETRLSAIPEVEITRAAPGSAFVVLTHDHGLDFLLTAAALERKDAAYVGLIGSATKRARFKRWCRDMVAGADIAALTCPMGAQGSRDKRPQIIAAFILAEVMAALTTAASATQVTPARLRAG